MESTVLSGVLAAHNLDYRKQRVREMRARHPAQATSGKADLAGWQQLASIAERAGNLQRGGERLVN